MMKINRAAFSFIRAFNLLRNMNILERKSSEFSTESIFAKCEAKQKFTKAERAYMEKKSAEWDAEIKDNERHMDQVRSRQ